MISEEDPRSNFAQNSNFPRSQEDDITPVSKEFEGRVTKKLSMEFSRTENWLLGALARLDNFFMNPLFQGHSETTPEMSRNAFSTNQGTNEDVSRVILILKQASSATRRCETLAKQTNVTDGRGNWGLRKIIASFSYHTIRDPTWKLAADVMFGILMLIEHHFLNI